MSNAFGDFLLEKGLYDTIEITNENISELAALVGGHVKISTYCPKCKENRVFSCEPIYCFRKRLDTIEAESLEKYIISYQRQLFAPTPFLDDDSDFSWGWYNDTFASEVRIMTFRFSCTMDKAHRLDYFVMTEENIMRKIGQYPSIADLSVPELKKYDKVMSEEDRSELRRAVGLNANGIGIGSYVYLRRIFERIVDRASNNAIADKKISSEKYAKAHTDDRIKMLAGYLPKGLRDNPGFYKIVSKGIHELSEKECIEYFPVLKGFIMMVFRQWERMREEEEEERSLSAELNRIATKIK